MKEITFKEWKKKYGQHNAYAKEIKSDKQFQALRTEFYSLTQGGKYECVYELAQMENHDMDDIFELIGIY